MAGKGTLSPHQNPQYGDKVALERLGSNTTTPMSGAPVQRRGAGRPATGQNVQQGQKKQPLPPGHRALIKDVVSAIWRLQWYNAVNQAMDTADTRMFLADAQRDFELASEAVKYGTPDMERS